MESVRFGLGHPQKEKGGLESPPFALLSNCFYIKKHITCKGKSGSGSISGSPTHRDLAEEKALRLFPHFGDGCGNGFLILIGRLNGFAVGRNG